MNDRVPFDLLRKFHKGLPSEYQTSAPPKGMGLAWFEITKYSRFL